MADTISEFCGIQVKNPIGVTSCDFGANEKVIKAER